MNEKIIAGIPKMSDAERLSLRENAGRIALSGIPAKQADAQAVLDALNEYERASRQALFDRVTNMSIAERVSEAFRAVPPTETDIKVSRALLDNPGSTSSDLTRACGWEGQSWHLHFGTMCFNRETWLWPAERFEKRDANFYSGILADFDDATKTFTMKSDVAPAMAAIAGVRVRRP